MVATMVVGVQVMGGEGAEMITLEAEVKVGKGKYGYLKIYNTVSPLSSIKDTVVGS